MVNLTLGLFKAGTKLLCVKGKNSELLMFSEPLLHPGIA